MLERQIMFKQLQELQRQKKLQELKDAHQQNVMDQLSLMHNKQSSGTQFGLLNYGVPVRDASQMFMFGDRNLVYSQPQNQVLQSMGLASQQYTHFQGPVFSQGLHVGSQTRKVPQVNNHDRYTSSQEFGRVLENVGGNQDLATLDPLEQKIMFNMEDNSWGSSFGKHGSSTESLENVFENTDNSSDFASLQSGSWSALMQTAVAEASSSDAGVQEEWSGLSFQNPENENPPSDFPGFQHFPATHFQNPKTEEMHSDSSHSNMSGFMDRSTEFPASSSTAQASCNMLELLHKVDKDYSHGPQSGYTDSASRTYVHKGESDDMFTPSSHVKNFGLRLGPPSQRPLVNYFDQSRISEKAFQGLQTDNNQLRNQNYMTNQSPLATPSYSGSRHQLSTFHHGGSQETSHLVSVKKEDGQKMSAFEAKQRVITGMEAQQVASSRKPANIWVDVPVQQNPSTMGACEPPSILYAANRRIETSYEASLKQEDAPTRNNFFLNPIKYDPRITGGVKNERVDYGSTNPQVTSLSQLNNYKSHPISSSATDQLVKSSSQSPLQDSSPDKAPSWLKNLEASKTNEVALARSSSIYLQQFDAVNKNMVLLKSKKRKLPTFEWLPWHKEVSNGCPKLHDISTSELEWAHSVNRLPEKLKEVADSYRVVRRKIRLILTTQLMQLIFRPAPTIATTHCDTITYYVAKLALGDACSLSSSPSGRTSENQDLFKIVESFIDRSKRLEEILSRLEKGESSILDIKVDFQDLDKVSLINRFAKFHSRGPLVTADTESSNGASTMRKIYPQRYVTASPMPSTVPEGQSCLLL